MNFYVLVAFFLLITNQPSGHGIIETYTSRLCYVFRWNKSSQQYQQFRDVIECLISRFFVSLLQDGATVLHHAACNANSFAIKAVLRQNADINACDNVSLPYWDGN